MGAGFVLVIYFIAKGIFYLCAACFAVCVIVTWYALRAFALLLLAAYVGIKDGVEWSRA
jgi:hypothetical protein